MENITYLITKYSDDIDSLSAHIEELIKSTLNPIEKKVINDFIWDSELYTTLSDANPEQYLSVIYVWLNNLFIKVQNYESTYESLGLTQDDVWYYSYENGLEMGNYMVASLSNTINNLWGGLLINIKEDILSKLSDLVA